MSGGAHSEAKHVVEDVAALHTALASNISGEVRFDEGSRAVYGSDASNYRQIPMGVVLPKTIEDVVNAVQVCRDFNVPILLRGGGTSQNGQCVNVAVVIDTSKYLNKVLEVNEVQESALVQPGAVCDALRDSAELHHLTFGPDPATHSRCTLGGMIGNNSCGPHSVMAGKTVENVEALEVLTYDGARFWVGPTAEDELAQIISEGGRRGEIYARLKALSERYGDQIRARFPKIKRRVSGYNLDQLLPENGFNVARALVGSEGTCVVTLQAKMKLVHSPQSRVLLVLGYPDIYTAADAVPDILPFNPIAMEGLDFRIIGGLRERGLRLSEIAMLPAGEAWMMVEFGADTGDKASQQANALAAHLSSLPNAPSSMLVESPEQQSRIWMIRETGASATAISLDPDEPNPVVGWEDAAVDPLQLGDYLREFQALVDRYGYKTSLYGHFGDGCIHARITFDLRSVNGVKIWRNFLHDAAHLVVKYGGSLSGEHGDGQAKAEFLPIMFGDELMQAFREFKSIWDPLNRMNPGKLIDAYRADENLRMGPDYQPIKLATNFKFPHDHGSFTRSVERCIGMGKCRSQEGGTMCPSYRATGEESYSTRGRSRLLFEMLRGDVIGDTWDSKAVKEALDFCLACKGCKSDCPTHVDMATCKAEFLSHYYEKHRRPIQAYTMGMIHRWARLAAYAPRLVNFITRMPLLRDVLKNLAGIAKERTIPRFATHTFRQWFASRKIKASTHSRVILWPDTFNNHFHPETAIAAVEVLEAAGYKVELPRRHLCCGRPLYDFGLLDQAKAQLIEIMETLHQDIEAGVPIIGLEPACVAVFRDELLNLFPHNPLAQKLSQQVFLFSEFIVGQTNLEIKPLNRKAVVHGHCHHKAVLGMNSENQLMKKLGLDITVPESGCCGMSGSFGFKPEHYELSMKIGEKSLLPSVRDAEEEMLVIADGYSCREQIEQGAGRQALHVAEVTRMALK